MSYEKNAKVFYTEFTNEDGTNPVATVVGRERGKIVIKFDKPEENQQTGRAEMILMFPESIRSLTKGELEKYNASKKGGLRKTRKTRKTRKQKRRSTRKQL